MTVRGRVERLEHELAESDPDAPADNAPVTTEELAERIRLFLERCDSGVATADELERGQRIRWVLKFIGDRQQP